MSWHLAKLILVAAVFAVCFLMLASAIGLNSPWLGLLTMFYLMGLLKVAEPLFVLHMPRALRTVGPGLFDHRLYRWLGVRGFGGLLRNTPLRHFNGSVYRSGGRQSLEKLQRQVESAEATHFWTAVLFTPYIAYVWSRGFLAEAVLFVAVQIAFNVYPILHLRMVRARLDKVALVGRRAWAGFDGAADNLFK
jgi:hypothetical protein